MKGLLTLLVLLSFISNAMGEQDFTQLRSALVDEISENRTLLDKVLGQPQLTPEVGQALKQVPRHEFVPAGQRSHAYENRPLPIGYGQTISQPLIVALMTDLMDLQADHRVLELGTGSGYQAAILAHIAKQVYSIEIVPELGERARKTLERLDYDNVSVRVGDGYHGWPEQAPFDAIIVTAAGDHVPPPLVQQLKVGGRLVIPVGTQYFAQQLVLIRKTAEGTLDMQSLLPVRFVPLTGGH